MSDKGGGVVAAIEKILENCSVVLSVGNELGYCWADGESCPYRTASFWGPVLPPDEFHCGKCNRKDLIDRETIMSLLALCDEKEIQEEVAENTKTAIKEKLEELKESSTTEEFDAIIDIVVSFVDHLELSVYSNHEVSCKYIAPGK